jgi:general secretion pathway protein D
VKEGDPDELSNELLGVLAPYGVTPTGEGEGGIYVVPLSRLNSIVVVAYDKTLFDEVDRWLKLLDIPPEEGAGRQTFVYPVENAKAADLADVLNELFGGGPGGGTSGGLGRAPGAPPAGVGLFGAGGVSGGRASRGFGRGGTVGGAALGGGVTQQAGMLGQQAGGGLGGTGTSLGSRGGAGRLGGRAGGFGATAGGGAPGTPGGTGARGVSLPGGVAGVPGQPGQPAGPPPIFKQEVRIVADEVTNSLVILATKRDYQLILDVLKRIDITPRQVLLEVLIAEVTLSKGLQFGVAWALNSGNLAESTPSTDNVFHNKPAGGSVGGLFPDTARFPHAAFAVITDRDKFNVLLSALQARTKVKMLSAPHIIAADNREAHILVGSSIPVLTSTSTSVLTTNPATVNSVQYRDTGKILTVLPQVNSRGLVNLQIRQEVSDILQTANGQQVQAFGNTGSPAFSTREAETTVVVHDGDSVVIGGIIDDKVTHTRSGIPYLMNIPVLGAAFRNESDSLDRTELIVLITPYVIRNRQEAGEVTARFTRGIREVPELPRILRERGIKRVEPPESENEGIPMDDRHRSDGSTPPPARKLNEVVPPEAAP